jgi:hypothetical protein
MVSIKLTNSSLFQKYKGLYPKRILACGVVAYLLLVQFTSRVEQVLTFQRPDFLSTRVNVHLHPVRCGIRHDLRTLPILLGK